MLTSNTDTKVRKQIMKALVWSTALYASETWTLRKENRRRIEAFEMWTWRKMMKIKYTERKTNEEVLQLIGEERQIIKTINQRQKSWIGHVLRDKNHLLKTVIEHFMGKPQRGRKRIGFLDYLKDGSSYQTLKERAQNRTDWKNWMPEDLPARGRAP